MTTIYMYLTDTSYRDRYDHQMRERWSVYYNREDRERIMCDGHGCHRRDGGQWKPVHSSTLHPDVFFWLMENIGIPEIVWECDRTYYPHEQLPELPKGGGRRAWEERFKSYYDFSTGQVPWRWTHSNSWMDYKKGVGVLTFKSKADAMFFLLRWSA